MLIFNCKNHYSVSVASILFILYILQYKCKQIMELISGIKSAIHFTNACKFRHMQSKAVFD